jgi:uncharacterized protein with PQ loop repeat
VIFEVFGLIGTVLLSIRGFPQVHKAYIKKNMESFSIWALLAWFGGCLSSSIYLIYKHIFDPLIVSNVFINTTVSFILLIAYWKYKK